MSLLTSPQKITCCYSNTFLHYFSPKNLGHKILSIILQILIFKNENQEVKATEATWQLSKGDKDLDL